MEPYTVRASCMCRLDLFLKNMAIVLCALLFACGLGINLDTFYEQSCTMNNIFTLQTWTIINGCIGVLFLLCCIFILNEIENIIQYGKIIAIVCIISGIIWTIIGTITLLVYCSCTQKTVQYISFALSLLYNYIFYSVVITGTVCNIYLK